LLKRYGEILKPSLKNILFILALVLVTCCAPVNKLARNSETLIDFRDNQAYPVVKIGSQLWMGANLNFKSISGSWCYNNDESFCEQYGRLYDYSTALTVCPNGWHLPSVNEWRKLRRNVGFSGSHLRSSSEGWKGLEGNSNSSGFSAVGSGLRDRFFHEGYYVYRLIDVQARYWCHSQNVESPDAFIVLYTSIGWWGLPIIPHFDSIHPSQGLAVRCVKN
jgi:uncharacterized protein (TIGR02145 family)